LKPAKKPVDRVYQRRWKMLAVLSLSMMIIGLDNTIVNVVLPTLQRQFSASASDLQWIVDAYLLVFAAVLLIMGTLGDRFGRKRALQGGLVLFAGASAAVLLTGTEQRTARRRDSRRDGCRPRSGGKMITYPYGYV